MGAGFEDLEVYQEARKLRIRIYALTRQLPDEEKYNLVSQMRRAALSATNCIAEGHGSRGWKHNISYLYRSRGSLNELIDQINCCEDEQYFRKDHLTDLHENVQTVIRLLNGYIRYLRSRLNDNPS